MRGRIAGIKKTDILRCSFFITWLLIIAQAVLSIVLLKNNYIWFFGLCFFLGGHLLVKSKLLFLDSYCYFGSLLFFVGISGVLAILTPLSKFLALMLILSFAFASMITYITHHEYFHFFIAILLFFVSISEFLSQINLIPFWISLAIGGVGVLLLLVKYFVYIKRS